MKRAILILFLVTISLSCATKLSFSDQNENDIVIHLSDFNIEPAYYLPGTYVKLISSTYQKNNSYTTTEQQSYGVETTTHSSSSDENYSIGEIGVRVNNLICVDTSGNILIDLIGLFNLENSSKYQINNNAIQFSREGNIIRAINSRFLQKDKEFRVQGENITEIISGKEKPFITYSSSGMYHYSNGLLATTENAIEYNKNHNYELTGSTLYNVEAIQEDENRIKIKQRTFLDGLTIKFIKQSPTKISIEISESLFKKEKYTFEVNGSEILVTNKKKEGVHLVLSENRILVEETEDAFIGNKVNQYNIVLDM